MPIEDDSVTDVLFECNPQLMFFMLLIRKFSIVLHYFKTPSRCNKVFYLAITLARRPHMLRMIGERGASELINPRKKTTEVGF